MWARLRELERRIETAYQIIRDLQTIITSLQNQLRDARGGS